MMTNNIKSLSAHPVARWLVIFILLAGVFFFHSFIVPILGALIIAFVTWPIYLYLLRLCKGRSILSASISIIFIGLLIVIPFFWLSHYLFNELKLLSEWLKVLNSQGSSTPLWIKQLPFVGEQLNEKWLEYLGAPNSVNELMQSAGIGQVANIANYIVALSKQLASIAFNLLFVLIILFFLYKDGRKFSKQINRVGEKIFPERWQRISGVVPIMIRATVSGMVIIAIGEGVIFGIAYYLAGAPAPLTLAIITGCFALIPGGAPMSMSIVSLYLIGSGDTTHGIFLFLWGAFQLFIVDKTIRPRLVGGPAKLPFLPTILGLVGGIKTMGIVGLFIGPVLMALLVVLWREWIYDEEHASNESLQALALAKAKKPRIPRKKKRHFFNPQVEVDENHNN